MSAIALLAELHLFCKPDSFSGDSNGLTSNCLISIGLALAPLRPVIFTECGYFSGTSALPGEESFHPPSIPR